jgi:steroid delta-isomerase-like uncharacterized protein
VDLAMNTAVIRRWVEAWHGDNLDVLDELFAPTYAVNGRPIGLEGIKQSVRYLRTVFGDPSLTIEDLVAERDRVVLRWTLRGNHSDTFMDIPPAGNPVTLTGTNIYRLADGKVAENWENVDVYGLLRQLGAVVTVAHTEE